MPCHTQRCTLKPSPVEPPMPPDPKPPPPGLNLAVVLLVLPIILSVVLFCLMKLGWLGLLGFPD